MRLPRAVLGARLPSRVALALAVALASGGCSFFFVKGPPSGHETMESFSCTESRTFPVLDAVWVGLNLITLATAESDWFMSREEKMRSSIVWIAVSGPSAVTGFKRVDRCRSALARETVRAAQEARLSLQRDTAEGPVLRRWPGGDPDGEVR